MEFKSKRTEIKIKENNWDHLCNFPKRKKKNPTNITALRPSGSPNASRVRRLGITHRRTSQVGGTTAIEQVNLYPYPSSLIFLFLFPLSSFLFPFYFIRTILIFFGCD